MKMGVLNPLWPCGMYCPVSIVPRHLSLWTRVWSRICGETLISELGRREQFI
jgi:hypothetical protein